MSETHKRVIVEHQNWYARDFRYVPAGKEVWGNCATFATTAATLAWEAGTMPEFVQDGTRHVAAVADGWAFGSLSKQPYGVGQ